MDPFEERIRGKLLDRTVGDVPLMRAALARGDRAEIHRLAHRLHGAAGALELDVLSELGRDLEAAALQAEVDRVAGLIDAVDMELGRLRARFEGVAR